MAEIDLLASATLAFDSPRVLLLKDFILAKKQLETTTKGEIIKCQFVVIKVKPHVVLC